MEKVILIGISPKQPSAEALHSFNELHRLAETAGALVTGTLWQRIDKFHPATLIGSGKADEILKRVVALRTHTVIFDVDLSPAQQRNLENLIPAKILDRTRLILDIFARRARTREGVLQVELAQLNYLLPRLTGRGVALSQQVGGIGTRGPGERKLEYERRRIRERIARLAHAIASIQSERETQRKRRLSLPFPTAAIIGYTNAGKSSLLNRIADAQKQPEVYADDMLFSTLDPTTRRVKLPGGGTALFTDTVGFIQNLPHLLVAAFRATLEEVARADCLIHLIDGSSAHRQIEMEAVEKVLQELGADKLPRIIAVNKADLLPADQIKKIRGVNPERLLMSAKTGQGVEPLLKAVDRRLTRHWLRRWIPLTDDTYPHLKEIYRVCQVVQQTSRAGQTCLKVRITPGNWARLRSHLKAPA
ncbi:MAG: GTPase HflX [Elusimicrobia bacterium]|nr:GTPase HflX [Elusimicrobiota bacterium]